MILLIITVYYDLVIGTISIFYMHILVWLPACRSTFAFGLAWVFKTYAASCKCAGWKHFELQVESNWCPCCVRMGRVSTISYVYSCYLMSDLLPISDQPNCLFSTNPRWVVTYWSSHSCLKPYYSTSAYSPPSRKQWSVFILHNLGAGSYDYKQSCTMRLSWKLVRYSVKFLFPLNFSNLFIYLYFHVTFWWFRDIGW